LASSLLAGTLVALVLEIRGQLRAFQLDARHYCAFDLAVSCNIEVNKKERGIFALEGGTLSIFR